MAKRHLVHMGKHTPLGSSWRSMDTQAYSRVYEPETRPEFRCFVTGQQAAMQEDYDRKVRLLDLKRRLQAKGLL
jgi:hypothetical protein